MRKLFVLALMLAGLLLSVYAVMQWLNHRTMAQPDREALMRSLTGAVDWLESNWSLAESTDNVILFWMLKQAAEGNVDPRLAELYEPYYQANFQNRRSGPWRIFFDPAGTTNLPAMEAYDGLPAYNVLFFYGASCDPLLGIKPLVTAQLEPGYCSNSLLSQRCVTHQAMGVRFMQRNACGDPMETSALLSALQDRIVAELSRDPRVGDAYIQRVLMLAESGAGERIKPVWIHRILAAQNADGGWGDWLDPILYRGAKLYGFSGPWPGQSNVHATMQAIWLLSLLLEQSPTD